MFHIRKGRISLQKVNSILCEDLLYQGYTCYVDDNESITTQLKQNPKLNVARLKYGKPPEDVQVIEIDL